MADQNPIIPSPESYIASVEHAWRRYSFRLANAFQILNYYLVAMAVLVAAFVGAIDNESGAVGAAVGLVVACMSAGAGFGFQSQIVYSREASERLLAVEDKAQAALGACFSESTLKGRAGVRKSTTVALAVFFMAGVSGLLGTCYALWWHS